VTARVVVHHGNDFESVPGIKGRSLKVERHEKHLSAATPACLLLNSPEQLCSQSLVASRRLHPELADFCASAPCVPADAGNNLIAILHEDCEPLAVRDACHGSVELVDSILQILNVAWRRLGADDEFTCAHYRWLPG
jgi:hypothetical protein